MDLDLEQANEIRLIWPASSTGRGETYAGVSQWLQVVATSSSSSSSHIVHFVEGELHGGQEQCNVTRLTPEQRAKNCQRIRPRKFQVSFLDNATAPPIGVHIRKTDRLQPVIHRVDGVRYDQTSMEESQQATQYAYEALTRLRPCSGVYVASDSPRDAQSFKERLRQASVKVVEPVVNVTSVPPFLVEFFALSQCQQVWMISAFSSFSVMAALVGDFAAPLYSLLPPPQTALQRYGVPDIRPFPTNHAWGWENTSQTNLACHPVGVRTPSATTNNNSTSSTVTNSIHGNQKNVAPAVNDIDYNFSYMPSSDQNWVALISLLAVVWVARMRPRKKRQAEQGDS